MTHWVAGCSDHWGGRLHCEAAMDCPLQAATHMTKSEPLRFQSSSHQHNLVLLELWDHCSSCQGDTCRSCFANSLFSCILEYNWWWYLISIRKKVMTNFQLQFGAANIQWAGYSLHLCMYVCTYEWMHTYFVLPSFITWRIYEFPLSGKVTFDHQRTQL